MASDFDDRCRKIARRFLVSAAVVDDQPYYGEPKPPGRLITPGRADRTVDDESPPGSRDRQSLDAGAITKSFSKEGLICGVVRPAQDEGNVVKSVERADLVVIDWKLHRDDGERALRILNSILDGDQDQRLRLIAVYTGESEIGEIGGRIREELGKNGRKFESGGRDEPVTLLCGPCRIEIYAKSNTPMSPGLAGRSVSEEELPGRLIDDFADMTTGLLPSIALVALTAVRENTYRVLDKFESGLDAAFLTHRACLPSPDDSERHMVAQIASELGAVMEERVIRGRPSGMEAIESWIRKYKGSGDVSFGDNKLTHECVLELLSDGVDTTSVPRKSKAYSWLTAGFVLDDDDSLSDLDLRFAWMTCFRAIEPPEKTLWIGTVVRGCAGSEDDEYLLCMRPRCDSVRMTTPESFLFLPLTKPRQGMFQLVVRSHSSRYDRVGVNTDMSRWKLIEFRPDQEVKAVVARKEADSYVFTDLCGGRYEWIGELKTDVAHSVGQALSVTLSRIALDRSEWLRRSERSG